MKILLLLLPAGLAALLAAALTPVVRGLARAVGALDVPDERKVHASPVPRMGGLSVVGSVCAVAALVAAGLVPTPRSPSPSLWAAIGLGVAPVFLISLWDDVRPRRALVKLAAHVAGAALAVGLGVRLGATVHLLGLPIDLGWLAFPLSILWIVAVTNAFNLIDGLDGLSAGLALISAASLTGVFVLAGRWEYATGSLILLGALAGFLPFNLHPATIFLGDSGACTVGFLLACLTLQSGTLLSAGLAVLVPVVILGVPLADAFLSVVRRALRKLDVAAPAGIMDADRRHIHHRLLALGLTHRRAVLILHGAGLALGLLGFASLFVSSRDAALFLLALLLAAAVGIGRLGYEELDVIRRGTFLKLYDAPVMKRGFFVVFVDVLMVIVAAYVAIGLKWDDWALVSRRTVFLQLAAVLPALTVATFWLLGLYRGRWRHASVEDLLRPSAAVVLATAAATVLHRALGRTEVSASLLAVFGLVYLLLTNGTRSSYRLLAHWRARTAVHGLPVLLYGAGRRGGAALREMRARPDSLYRPVGFLDDDPEKAGRILNGLTVLGDLDALPELAANRGVKAVVVTSAKIPAQKVAAVEELCQELGIAFLRFRLSFEGDIAEPTADVPRSGRGSMPSVSPSTADLVGGVSPLRGLGTSRGAGPLR